MKLLKTEPDNKQELPPELKSQLKKVARQARSMPPDQGEALITGQCNALFDAHNESSASLQSALLQAEHDKAFADNRQQDIEEKLKQTPVRLIAPPDDDQTSLTEPSDSHRGLRLKDQYQLWLYGVLTLLLMYVSFQNVYAILLATGEVVFIEDKYKAMAIAALAPAVSTAIKNLPNFFYSVGHKHACERAIYGVTALSAILWIGLFAYSFEGVSGGMPDLSDLSLEGDTVAHWQTFSQLWVEVMCAASLFIRFNSLLDRLQPEQHRKNPDYLGLTADLEQARVQAQYAEKQYEAARTALSQHEAKRQLLINDTLSVLASEQAKYRDLHQG
jgi:hypothetical protein